MDDLPTALDDLKDRVSKLETAVIYGNGKPSLLARIEAVETSIKTLAADVGSIRASMSWVVKLIIGQLIMLCFQFLPKIVALAGK